MSANRTAAEYQITMTASDIVTVIVLTIIMIIGIVGNLLVIYVFGFRTKRRRRVVERFEAFLILLAVVDLLSSLIVPLAFMYLTITQFRQWHFGEIGCKVIPSLLQITITISQGVLILISFERYHTLVKPFSDRLSFIEMSFWIGSVVILAFGFASPYMSTLIVQEDIEYHMKTCTPDKNKYHVLMGSSALQLLRDVVAIAIMGVLCNRINHALVKQDDIITWKRKNYSKKSRKLLRTVVMVFGILSLPVDFYQFVVYIILHSNVGINKSGYDVIRGINTMLNLLQVSNSVVNVFIYSRMHSMFRLQCFAKQRDRKFSRQSTSYEVTETEFLHIDGRRISRHQKQ